MSTSMSMERYVRVQGTRDAQEQLISGRYSARCMSGYRMDSTDDTGGRVCKRMASRGSMLCGECSRAVIVADVAAGKGQGQGQNGQDGRAELVGRVLGVLVSVTGVVWAWGMLVVLTGQGVAIELVERRTFPACDRLAYSDCWAGGEQVTVNVLTRGQSVRVIDGKYAGQSGTITRAYLYGDSKHVGYQYRVRLPREIGQRTYSTHSLKVGK